MPSDRSAARLDDALTRLRPESAVDDKLAALRLLVDYWHEPILPDDGIPAEELAGLALPRPLLWWYRWAGRREAIMSGQNMLYQPGKSRWRLAQDGRLLFQIENQACHFWSTLAEGDDPPVFSRESEARPWQKEQVTLAEHLMLNAMHEVVMCHAEFRACSMSLSELKLNAIAERVPRLAIGPWRWCDMHFHAGGGALMTASLIGEADDRRVFMVWLGARRQGVLDFLEPFLGEEWECAEL